MTARQTFRAVKDDRPMAEWLRADAPPFFRIEVDPTETVEPGGVRISVGFPVLEVAGCVKDAEKFAGRVVLALNGPSHGWTITANPGSPVLALQHEDGRAVAVNVDEEERRSLFMFRRPITEALRDVALERERQSLPQSVDRGAGFGEGWTNDHDDRHGRGELAAAAGVYALAAARLTGETQPDDRFRHDGVIPANLTAFWPWAAAWWKPSGGVRRMLVKAAALILAEIERMDRNGASADVIGRDQT